MIAGNVVDALRGGLADIADVETIIGRPMVIRDVTLIPVISLNGFMMGGGKAGGGAAGGFRVEPVAMVVIRESGVEVLQLRPSSPGASRILEALPNLLGGLRPAPAQQQSADNGNGDPHEAAEETEKTQETQETQGGS